MRVSNPRLAACRLSLLIAQDKIRKLKVAISRSFRISVNDRFGSLLLGVLAEDFFVDPKPYWLLIFGGSNIMFWAHVRLLSVTWHEGVWSENTTALLGQQCQCAPHAAAC